MELFPPPHKAAQTSNGLDDVIVTPVWCAQSSTKSRYIPEVVDDDFSTNSSSASGGMFLLQLDIVVTLEHVFPAEASHA
jgi:hypothetical protein